MTNSKRPGDSGKRLAEGWQFYLDIGDTNRDIIIAVDRDVPGGWDPRAFYSNKAAVAYVTQRAAEGSAYHAECLAYAVAERMK
jgi:hypothetical protein